jgi:hypothetical protein
VWVPVGALIVRRLNEVTKDEYSEPFRLRRSRSRSFSRNDRFPVGTPFALAGVSNEPGDTLPETQATVSAGETNSGHSVAAVSNPPQ